MDPIVTFCLRMGDTTLILGQQTAAWCGHAPVLEEDIAFANMGLDLIGQTQLWYEIAAEAEGKGRTPDDLAFFRTERQFLNAQLVERPNTDFAHALMRQYLFDAWHLPMQEALCDSSHEAIRDLAQKSVKEVRYHIDRSRDLIVRLGDGSDESRAKMQGALDALWPYAGDLMATDEVEETLAGQGVLPGLDRVRRAFDAETAATLSRATLTIPENGHARTGGRTGIHTETMGYILAEMQSVPRTFPDARW
ncbi:1,2-phenylacetyl-CoA epoxidase subunit PaaC [Limimaricola cinnabarinus]|jgi:ring-1,2-phenylacetyl-CoA epoxidase subunit PaaC|uniref:Phenylacetate-CoA oxygenase subunit PaaI n=1 Tax=Limimaricola cinnabarinus TaxID=1125964 RepID=A0A2G1MD41_9RHOB|nr:1,2-phenylacetyl-CoA epoxidase subunit PaaC [Limimaricola cinnabarinus]PHP26654.1 phenylacetate-CoA oxygenase subunit PaaI [Limimaricola cinnabarinus]